MRWIPLFIACVLQFSGRGSAGELPRNIPEILPREVDQVGFIDLEKLRDSKHYAQIKQKMLPERFEQLELFLKEKQV